MSDSRWGSHSVGASPSLEEFLWSWQSTLSYGSMLCEAHSVESGDLVISDSQYHRMYPGTHLFFVAFYFQNIVWI